MTRVEVRLSQPAEYEVMPSPEGLAIEVRVGDPMDEVAMEDGGQDWEEVVEDDPWLTSSGEDADEMAMAAEPMVEAKPATMLSSVDARGVGAGSMVHLQADGAVESAVTFTLEDPARLVIDLPEMKSEVSETTVDVDSDQVARVRVGAHADKVRVVIDGGDGANAFDGRQVIPVATGLLVALGSDPMLEEEVAALSNQMPEASEWMADASDSLPAAMDDAAMDDMDMADTSVPASILDDMDAEEESAADAMAEMANAEAEMAALEAEPMTGEGLVRIFGVEFDVQPDRSRVVVVGEGASDYLVYEPDPGTVVLSITNAEIAPEAAVRIAPETPGPVSLVTAFDQPDVETPEVRVVVKRAAGLKPVVSRDGGLLMMDFANERGTAAAPPVYDTAGAMADAAADPMATAPMGDVVAMEGMALEAMPAAIDPDAGMAMDGMGMPDMAAMPADAASAAPPAAIEILNEGGLMDGKEYVGRRISLDFKEVDIADVLRLIAEVSDLNVIAGDEVSGKVTIRLVDVPWDQALDVILLTKGLGFARIGNVLRIAADRRARSGGGAPPAGAPREGEARRTSWSSSSRSTTPT